MWDSPVKKAGASTEMPRDASDGRVSGLVSLFPSFSLSFFLSIFLSFSLSFFVSFLLFFFLRHTVISALIIIGRVRTGGENHDFLARLVEEVQTLQ